MALIKCSECGHEVSDRASACPNCGCPIGNVGIIQERTQEKERLDLGFDCSSALPNWGRRLLCLYSFGEQK